jgi:hypothetical protein
VLVGLLIGVQPVLGILQHLYFRKAERRGVFGWSHLLLGRIILVLGLVNGARGFKLAHDNKTAPYFAVLGLICALYVGVLFWDWLAPRYKARKAERNQNSDERHGHEAMEMNSPEDERK